MVDTTESLKMAFRTLTSNRLRSALTMLGIIIGNASVIAMVGVGDGAQRFVAHEIENLGPNTLFIRPGNKDLRRLRSTLPKTLVLKDAEAIAAQVDSVRATAPIFNDRDVIVYRNRSINTSIVGTTASFPIVNNFNMDQGTFFTELNVQRSQRVVVLGSTIAQQLFDQQSPLGQKLRIKQVSFRVIGVLEEKGSSLGYGNYDDAVLVPLTVMSRRLVGETSPFGVEVSNIVVSVQDEQSIEAAQFQITNLLRLRHRIQGEDDFSVSTQKDLLDFTNRITSALTTMLAAISSISLLVGGIGVMNIMLVSVKERTQEIGLRKAIGASEEDILIQFMIEAFLLAAAGGLIGVAIGVSGLLLIGVFTPFQPQISGMAVVAAVGVSGSIGLVFGVLPAQQAAKLDPIVALRSA
ncbi:MAG: ABC transporter permease [Leptolyngbyaceae cyanobacterium MO_188.B28]|nr:ABC transporter permease [Leptolyngbyaceae cyanobacterium MO_188.B28]